VSGDGYGLWSLPCLGLVHLLEPRRPPCPAADMKMKYVIPSKIMLRGVDGRRHAMGDGGG
jgi:hypothetical protein